MISPVHPSHRIVRFLFQHPHRIALAFKNINSLLCRAILSNQYLCIIPPSSHQLHPLQSSHPFWSFLLRSPPHSFVLSSPPSSWRIRAFQIPPLCPSNYSRSYLQGVRVGQCSCMYSFIIFGSSAHGFLSVHYTQATLAIQRLDTQSILCCCAVQGYGMEPRDEAENLGVAHRRVSQGCYVSRSSSETRDCQIWQLWCKISCVVGIRLLRDA